MNKVSKTYYWTNEKVNKFPPEFLASKNQRFIIVEQCKAVYADKLVGDVLMHADFIKRDHYMDYACCFINEIPNKDTAKYEYNSTDTTFRLWFTDLKNNEIEVDSFVLRLLLIY